MRGWQLGIDDTAGDGMRLATRITIGILAAELIVMATLLVLAGRWVDMGWPALGMEHPLIVVTAVALVLLVGTRIVVAEVGAWRAHHS